MRTPVPLALLAAAALPLTGLACGGGSATAGGAVAPASSGTSANVDSSANGPGDAGPTTTTTATLGAGGDLQGEKLTRTTTVASAVTTTGTPAKGPHTHEPGRGRDDLRAIVMAHRDEARACYDAALTAHPGIQGALVVQWTIDPKGNVTEISEDVEQSEITEPGLVACVASVIKRIQFAASAGGYETRAFYPFKFTPRGSPQSGGAGGGTP
jgi:hypothetical protein